MKRAWLSCGGRCGFETQWKSCDGNGIDGRDRAFDCEVACARRRACLCERAHTAPRRCGDCGDPVACCGGQGRWHCGGLFGFCRRGGGDRETSCGRCAREQRGNFRAEAVRRDPRCRLVSLFRGQRNERSAARATLSYRNAEEELGPHPFYVERVGGTDPGRDGALRNDENGTDCRGSRDCGVGGGNRCDREQYCCRSHGVGRCGRLCRGDGEAAEQVEVRGREGVL